LIGRVSAGLGVLAGIACAAIPRAPAGYAFPGSFEVNQVVTVEPDGPGRREFLASLGRVQGDYQVTLFDGALQVPILSASVRAGVVSVQVMAAGMDGGYGHRLVELLRDLYGRDFPAPIEGRTESDAGAFAVRLAGVPPSSSACRFPSTIEVIPNPGGGPHLLVRTIDVACTTDR
jgi:hypothetical protein